MYKKYVEKKTANVSGISENAEENAVPPSADPGKKHARGSNAKCGRSAAHISAFLAVILSVSLLMPFAGARAPSADAAKYAAGLSNTAYAEGSANADNAEANNEALDSVGRADPQRRTVRVAFPEQAGMSFIGRTGHVTGYNYDYLEKISEYTGWDMDYEAYTDMDANEAINNAISDLMSGKVDLMGPMLKSEQTEKLFEFPEHSYGTVYTTLCVKTTSPLRESSLASIDLLRVGLWESAATRNQEVIDYLDTENIPYEITYYDTSDEQKLALQNGQIDAMSSLSLSPVENTRIIAQFAARPYYFAATKGNTELVAELDRTIEKLDRVQPRLQENLYETYFKDADNSFTLTADTKKTLQDMGSISVLCIDSDAPFVYEVDGEPRGALVSVINDFAGKVNMKAEFKFCSSRGDAEKALKEHSYDIIAGIPFTSKYCAEIGFVKSEPVLQSNLAYVESPYKNNRKNVAIVEGLEELIDTSQFDNVIYCGTAEECIKAVNDKKADLAVGDRSVMEYYIYETYSTLATSLITGGTQDVCVALSKNSEPAFMEAFNDYVYSLSDLDKTVYLSDGNVHENSSSFVRFVRMNPMQATLIVVIMTILLASGIYMILYARQMNRKNNELREANEVRTGFLTRMSHDIRTPMNGIIGMLQLADKAADDPVSVRKYHRRIQDASEHLLSLINDVLEMSDLSADDLEVGEESVDLRGIIDECCDMMAKKAEKAGVVMDTSALERFDAPNVITEKRHVKRIFVNIIENAVKYNRQGGSVSVTAEAAALGEGLISCTFIVKDNGLGMSEEFQQHMFEPFVQERAGARGEYTGTGLGLSIVKRLVDHMGGELDIKSVEGEGTSVTWTQEFKTDAESCGAGGAEEQVSLKGMKILAAEDNCLNTEILQLMLENEGAEVVMVENGELEVEAFKNAEPGTFDYILTDLMMPVMDGYEASRRIRAMAAERPDAADIPIIALTANAFAHASEKSAEAGISAHITKPFTVEKLKKCMAELRAAQN